MSEAAETPAQDATPYPSAAAGWFLVIMLTIAYIFSFVDRYILGLLIEPIKAEFGLSDRAIGWLLSAFTLVYGFVGIFMGWLIDRGKRDLDRLGRRGALVRRDGRDRHGQEFRPAIRGADGRRRRRSDIEPGHLLDDRR